MCATATLTRLLSGEPQTPTAERYRGDRRGTDEPQRSEELTMPTHSQIPRQVLGSCSPPRSSFAGCVVGPNFKSPAPPNVTGYTSTPPSGTSSVPNLPGGEAQQFVPDRDIPGDWWTLFHSTPLNNLIEQALKANPDLKAAQAALLVARENVLAQRGVYYPNVSEAFRQAGSRRRARVLPCPTPASLISVSTRLR